MSSKKFTTTVSLDLDLKAKLEALRIQKRRSRSNMVEEIVREYFLEIEKEKYPLWESDK